jgi:hypothetical protein
MKCTASITSMLMLHKENNKVENSIHHYNASRKKKMGELKDRMETVD